MLAATAAGSRKIPPPMVMLTMLAVSPRTPTSRTNAASSDLTAGCMRSNTRREHPGPPCGGSLVHATDALAQFFRSEQAQPYTEKDLMRTHSSSALHALLILV